MPLFSIVVMLSLLWLMMLMVVFWPNVLINMDAVWNFIFNHINDTEHETRFPGNTDDGNSNEIVFIENVQSSLTMYPKIPEMWAAEERTRKTQKIKKKRQP